jgi:hypothetical protein
VDEGRHGGGAGGPGRSLTRGPVFRISRPPAREAAFLEEEIHMTILPRTLTTQNELISLRAGIRMLKLGALLGGIGTCGLFALVILYLMWSGSLTFGWR